MDIYLPIAEMSVNVLVLLTLGGMVGFLSGMFGVGGGFLMTPLLIFYGIPPAVSVSAAANQIVASSFSGVIVHWQRGTVDFKMGAVLLSGGVVGSVAGVWIFSLLRALGQVDLLISLCYVTFLGIIGGLMLVESVRAIRAARLGTVPARSSGGHHHWVHGLPLKMRFHRSRLYISAIPPFGVGLVVGILAAVMGVGGGFIMVPAMIYLLRMPTNVVVGTSLFQIIFMMALVTILHATENRTVDFILALILIVGGVIGAQWGARVGKNLKGEQLRALLAIIVLSVCVKMAFDLFMPPSDPYSVIMGGQR